MAEIHAIQNGNWSDTSTWDLGRVPDVDDDVYLDYYSVVITELSLTVATLNKGSIVSTTVNNGTFQAESISDVRFEFYSNDNIKNYTINCNIISVYRDFLINTRADGGTININGNISIYSTGVNVFHHGSGRSQYINIVGNVINNTTNSNNIYLHNTSGGKTTIVGILDSISARMDTSIIGNLYSRVSTLAFTSLFVKGNIYYTDTSMGNKAFGFTANSFDLSEIKLWKNLTEYSIYPYQIITNYQIDNNDNYPIEDDVKEGVKYAYGLKEGNYLPNLPQEATVLKDVEYGDDKVGTLEVIALSGATATAENISVVNLTEQDVERVKNCATVSTVQKCFEDFKE